jgi:ferredoxin-NADP reductase
LVEHHRPGFYFRVLEAGEVAAGDEIVKVSNGPERMSVAEADALLYLTSHSRAQLERALRIPALSVGWRGSFEALLTQERSSGAMTGNAGLTAAAGPPPAWRGFRPLRVSRKVRESSDVISLVLGPTDKQPLTAALPGQFVVLRLRPASNAPALMRSYSLSGEPSAERYRVSVKREAHGAAGIYIDDELQVGDVADASAARGSFTLRPGNTPVVLLSGGIGATPVLAILHALAAEASTREIWWLYGARSSREHPFAEETRSLLKVLAHGHSHIRYSAPDPEDWPGVDFDAPGRLNMRVLQELSLPRNGDFYICGPSTLHERSDCRPRSLGRRTRLHPHRDFRRRSFHYPRHCCFAAPAAALAGRASRLRTAGLIRPQRSQCSLGATVREPARVRRSLRRTCAMVVSNGGLPHL